MTKYIIIDFKKEEVAKQFKEMLHAHGIEATIKYDDNSLSFNFNGYISACNNCLKDIYKAEVIKMLITDEKTDELKGQLIIHRKDITELWL